MSALVIRKLRNKDLEVVSNVVNRAMKPSLKNLSEMMLLKRLERNSPANFLKGREGVEYWIGEINYQIVGIIGLLNNEIKTFYVDPKFQGKGVGRLLYNKVKELSLTRKLKQLTVRSSPEAEEVYKHFGFKKVKKIYKTDSAGNISFTILMTLVLG